MLRFAVAGRGREKNNVETIGRGTWNRWGGGGGKVENKSMGDTKDYINVKSEDNFKKLSEMKKNI